MNIDLTKLREEKGLQKSSIAKRLHTSIARVTGLEQGKRPISEPLARTIGEIYGCNYKDILN